MPAKVRVFVSSTMEDLANERAAVVDAIARLGLQPVNAEDLLPNGETSWDLLAEEIRSCHLCILILGERYGWKPDAGYGAGQDKSVTHLEFDLARSCGIPVLPFYKTLKYGADANSEDAKRRDAFRNEVGEWAKGVFRVDFRLAHDLGDKVRQSLLDVFVDTWLKASVQTQGAKAAPRGPSPNSSTVPIDFRSGSDAAIGGPTGVRPRTSGNASDLKEVLFAGAGLSLSAGYPAANAIAGILARTLGYSEDTLLGRYGLAELFEAVQQKLGQDKAVTILRELLDPPLPTEPTAAHIAAVQRFPVILTTNYDLLFERACTTLGIPFEVRTPFAARPHAADAKLTIYKIDGSMDRPETLILSNSDAQRAREDIAFWTAIEGELAKARPIVIGHSMRDPISLRLMENRDRTVEGIYVAPVIDPIAGTLLLRRLNLKGVEDSASHYLLSSKH